MSAKRSITAMSFAVHLDNESPIYGESSTHVRLEDEAAGEFLVLSQCHDAIKPGEIRIDFEDFDLIVEAVKKLRRAGQ